MKREPGPRHGQARSNLTNESIQRTYIFRGSDPVTLGMLPLQGEPLPGAGWLG